jgi:hypothetical protein
MFRGRDYSNAIEGSIPNEFNRISTEIAKDSAVAVKAGAGVACFPLSSINPPR